MFQIKVKYMFCHIRPPIYIYLRGGGGYNTPMVTVIVQFPHLYGFSLKCYDTKIRFNLTVNGLFFQRMDHSNQAWNQSAKGQHIPGIRYWSWRKSSTTTDTWPEGGGLRSPTPWFCPNGRLKSGFRTDVWSGRRIISYPIRRTSVGRQTRPELQQPQPKTARKTTLQRDRKTMAIVEDVRIITIQVILTPLLLRTL